MWLFGCVTLLSMATLTKASTGVFVQPDFESSWTTIQATSGASLTTLRLSHGLGETPLLVDVQVKVTSGANQNYIFPASGCRPRDDDQPEEYGGVIYIYNENEVFVSAPTQNNDYLGRCVYAGLSPYWEGPTTEDTYIAEVKVRCWKAGTLPTPDFSETGIFLQTGTSMYVTRDHSIGDYPALVVSRTRLATGSYGGYYSDSVGSPQGMYTGLQYQRNGYVTMGYSATAIRIWAPTDSTDYLFDGSDGWAIGGASVNGTLELFAWSESSLIPNVTGSRTLGPSVAGADLYKSYTSVGTTDETFVRAWVQATDGNNNGFRFPGTGMSAHETTTMTTPCTYGGLQFAYTDTNFRFWQPGNGANGFLVCIPETLGGVNDQASTSGVARFSAWHLDLDDCSSGPCQNGATCTNYAWGYTCTCAAGFTGTDCEINIDECSSNPCNNGATCVDTVNGYTCTCASGWTGTYCDTDIDECSSNPCNNGGSCTDEVNGFTCACAAGWTGVVCDTNIDECSSNPCNNGATCVDDVNSYMCTCAPGWTGTHCDTDIDECSSNPCENNATCIDDVNGYTCTCPSGWTGTHCETDIDECSSNPCNNGATCIDDVNGYTCECAPGYSGIYCDTDVDECSSNPCDNGATCVDDVNGYTCTCAPGWTGTHCDTDIDECSSNPCSNGGTCVDDVNGYTCMCKSGYNGDHCQIDIDECSSNPCSNGATCVDDVNGYTCTCAPGWMGTHCDTDIDECSSNPCENNATCVDGVNGYTCSCASGWEGTHCGQDIDECAVNTPCMNNGVCNNQPGDFQCMCLIGWTGKTCTAESSASWSVGSVLLMTVSILLQTMLGQL